MKNDRAAIEILEQSVSLLRSSPQALVIYLAGAIPFVLALLVFLNDMILSPYAFDHLAAASLGLAALYVWKNVLQAIFVARLYQTLSPNEKPPSSAPLHNPCAPRSRGAALRRAFSKCSACSASRKAWRGLPIRQVTAAAKSRPG